jgi:hypothetical protein
MTTRTIGIIMNKVDENASNVEKLRKIDYPLWNHTVTHLPPRMIITVGVPGMPIAIFPPPQISWLWRIRDEITNQLAADLGR